MFITIVFITPVRTPVLITLAVYRLSESKYNAVKDLYGMRQQGNYDQRINSLLNGLERIVQSIAELRNTQSDAHGAGRGRIAIKEREARLIMNSSMVLCEYLISVHQEHMHTSTP